MRWVKWLKAETMEGGGSEMCIAKTLPRYCQDIAKIFAEILWCV